MARIITFSSALCCFLFFFSFLSLKTMSQPQPTHLHTYCVQSKTFSRTSSYQSNRETVLSSLDERSSLGTYSNATAGLIPDKVHGMYLCRGDITKTSCSLCVKIASLEIAKNCTDQKEGFIYYEECMVRYSDKSFSGLLEGPYIMKYSFLYFPIGSGFDQTLVDKMNKLIPQAVSSLSPATPYFVEDKEGKSSYTLDSLVQCSPDLDPGNCTACLTFAVQDILDCCSGSRMVQIFLPKCLVKYDTTALPVTSLGAIQGSNIFGRGFIAVITVSVLALVGL